MRRRDRNSVQGICRIPKTFFSTMLGNILTRDLIVLCKYAAIGLRGSSIANCFYHDHTTYRKKPPINDGDGRILKDPNDKWRHNAW